MIEVLATLDPTISEYRVVLWVDRVHEANDVVSPFVLVEFFVLGEKCLLGLRVSLAGHALGLFVDETEAMQQCGHPVGGVGDAKCLIGPRGDILGRQVQMCLNRHIQGHQISVGERAVASLVGHVQQTGQTALLIAPKMVAHGVGVDQQDFGDLLCRLAAR